MDLRNVLPYHIHNVKAMFRGCGIQAQKQGTVRNRSLLLAYAIWLVLLAVRFLPSACLFGQLIAGH
jgi:hypothetical protein